MKKPSGQPAKIHRGPEAKIAICKCGEAKKVFGVRFEADGLAWKYTWAFPIREETARREGYDNTILKGNIYPDEEYLGCPYCRRNTFIICSACHKLSCNVTAGNTCTCEWCGMTGIITAYDGEGISSGGDLG